MTPRPSPSRGDRDARGRLEAEAGRIGLDLPVARYLPEWKSRAKSGLAESRYHPQFIDALFRASGAQAVFPYAEVQCEYIAAICREPLEYAPGTKTIYSDLGFILLSEILERTTGNPVDQLAQSLIFAPLDMGGTMFNPPSGLLSRYSPY